MPTEVARSTMDGQAPDLSIVIVNLDAAAMLRRCLESIRDTAGSVGVEAILVDNHSTDGSVAVARAAFPGLVVLAQERNLGYVPANNIGLAAATGRAVMFLNNDTLVEPGCLEAIARFLDANPEVGALGGRIVNPDGSDQGAARRFPTLANAVFGRRSLMTRWFPANPWSRRYLASREHSGDAPFEVEHVSSAALVLRTALARELGGMDEGFRLYWVDAELCRRVMDRGYKVYCVPAARIVHFEGQGGSTRTLRQRWRTILWFHLDAFRAYVKIYKLPRYHPGRLLAAVGLSVRAMALMAAQALRPGRTFASGGRN